MKKVEEKSIEEKELKKLQEFELFFQKANEALGQLTIEFEFKKSDILRQVSEKATKREELKKELSETYGENITIDLSTGLISIPEKE
jgi:phenylacetate-coenzyme A ligase PaaK-like adenylate-forming protein